MGSKPNTAHLDWQQPCRAAFNCTRRKLLIRHVCVFSLLPVEKEEEEGDLARWWMPSLLPISKVQFIREEWSSLLLGGGKIAFFLTCSQGGGSEWKAIWECLPSEVMNTPQIRGRGFSFSSASALCVLTAPDYFLCFAPQPIPTYHFFPWILSFRSFFISFLSLVCACLLVWADRLSSGRSAGWGQHLQNAGQKAETARPSVRTQWAGATRPCRVTENHDLDPWAEKKKNQPRSVKFLQDLAEPGACMCACMGARSRIWWSAQSGLDRAHHELLSKTRILQSINESLINKLIMPFSTYSKALIYS